MDPPSCRCCLSTDTLTSMRKNNFTTQQTSVSYLDAYLTLLNIQEKDLIEANEDLLNICITCSSHLESAFIFRQLCSDVNEMLKNRSIAASILPKVEARRDHSITNKTKNEPSYDETPFIETMKIIQQVKVEESYEQVDSPKPPVEPEAIMCVQCNSPFKTLSGLSKHIQKMHQHDYYGHRSDDGGIKMASDHPKKQSSQCDECSRTFLTESGLARHIARKHANYASAYQTFTQTQTGGIGNVMGKFACPSCDKSFHHLSTLNLHREKHSTEKFQCPLCPASYKHSFNLKTHLSKIHKVAKGQ